MLRRFALLLLLPACIVITDNDDEPDDIDTVLVHDLADECPGEPAWVTRAALDGDDLIVDAGYGGCNEARVWACWDGVYLDSLPGQVYVEIHHGEAGDCDAAFQGTYRFHLDPVVQDAGDGPLVIHTGDQTVTWER
jgi:hypothetical protein